MGAQIKEASISGVIVWLVIVFLMVAAMVIIGGVTRLTGSGLSMVEWRPLMGTLPPLNGDEWERVFRLYQASPQYELVNYWMDISAFKQIFIWEYLHRLIGRLIGLVVFLPGLYFFFRKRLKGRLLKQVIALFVLGGLQGLMGWYMVKSGLVDLPAVSHYRLTAHLLLALVIACFNLWVILELYRGEVKGLQSVQSSSGGRLCFALLLLTGLQIIYGALMAGLKAGVIASTYPDMNGLFIPQGMGVLEPVILNLFDNPITVHFLHRVLGIVVLIVTLVVVYRLSKGELMNQQKRCLLLLFVAIIMQFCMGIVTVISGVTILMASLHQVGAFILLSILIWNIYEFTASDAPA